VVLDTSGSMSGEKLDLAKTAVEQLLEGMSPDDEVALVRYADDATVLQPLDRVGRVRHAVVEQLRGLQAAGGTNIPPALNRGLATVREATAGRVTRLVLVSDGLDSTRDQSVSLARGALREQVTTSAIGIGLDFDESYMSAVSNAGRGNFAFVESSISLGSFLRRELNETARTVVTAAEAHLELPPELRFVRAMGAEVSHSNGHVGLHVGAMFAGDERRVVVELASAAPPDDVLPIRSTVQWTHVGGAQSRAELAPLLVTSVRSRQEAESSRVPGTFASCLSAATSMDQLAVAEAYRRGDAEEAVRRTAEAVRALRATASSAPRELAATLEQQADAYDARQQGFQAAPPASPSGRALAKEAFAADAANLSRQMWEAPMKGKGE
jgi:Ca-activated chloride channel family protein